MPEAAGPHPERVDVADPDLARLLDRLTQLALVVAADGAALIPAADVPAPVRPLLKHRKTTSAARATLRRVLDQDAPFRERVAAALDADARLVSDVGPAGALFVRRPPGWEDELLQLVAEDRAARDIDADAAVERRASRKLRSVEERAAALEAAATAARRDAEAARAEALESRRAARTASDEAAGLGRRLAEAERHVREGRDALAEHGALQARREAELSEAQTRAETLVEQVAALTAEVVGLRAALRDALVAPTEPTPPLPVDVEEPDDDAAGAVASAARAAAELGAALDRAAAALAEERDDRRGSGRAPRAVKAKKPGARRRPASLPPAVLEGSGEEADHLVRLDGLTILVDGYNATLRTWPELSLPEQRARLIDLMAGLAARFGCHVEIVFDGALVVDVAIPPAVRSLVKVDFTDADVEADDVLIDRARRRRLPVVVVSDDRRVRDGARQSGANVLTVAQLLGAARRP